MKKILMILSLLLTSSLVHAAPYYEGPGCDAEGNRCLFGRPSDRVVFWSKSGSVETLGSRCELFIQNIQSRSKTMPNSKNMVLDYRNFTYSWTNVIDANGRANIRCHVEIHSENPNYRFKFKSVIKKNWVCESKSDAGICRNYLSDCVKARDQAMKDPAVLDATIYRDASLLQGSMCSVSAIVLK
ncbi:hypothetical protein BDW_08670 [Bdellovibrio bacteriovorus W]|nr:hypothetical protein BDW_08670 [Bdellovibrio bacteriovorus W]